MGLGIGLGGFAEGFESGYGLGKDIAADIKKNRRERSIMDALQQGTTDYNAAVASGAEQPNDPNGVLRYAYPKLMHSLQSEGDIEGMQKVSEWIKSDQAKQGTQLFMSGMLKGQNGDMGGALRDFLAAGKVQGFGNYQVSEPKPLADGGISVTITDPASGKSSVQQFKTADDVLKFGATYFNPEAQFKQWQEGQATKSEYARDVAKAGETERAKLTARTENDVVRKNLGLGISTGRDMIAARRQALYELKESPSFAAATDDEQQAMIDKRAQELLAGAQPGVGEAPKRRVIIDTKTGRVIPLDQ
jgi:hypothetical protein